LRGGKVPARCVLEWPHVSHRDASGKPSGARGLGRGTAKRISVCRSRAHPYREQLQVHSKVHCQPVTSKRLPPGEKLGRSQSLVFHGAGQGLSAKTLRGHLSVHVVNKT